MKWTIIMLLLLAVVPAVSAAGIDSISDEDKELFDEILTPITKVYQLVKYVATTVAGLVLLFAGISYMVSGGDPKKRDQSKSMAMYVIVGLVIIWAAPLLVDFLVT